MKKYRLILPLLIIALTVSVMAAVLPVGAATDSGNIWKITHADGTVSYSTSFPGAFETIQEGDVFEFLPDEYYLYKADFVYIRTPVDITIDLRGATIYCPEIGDLGFNAVLGDVDGQMMSIYSNAGAHVNVLLEDARLFAPLGGRTAFSVSGDCTVDFDGGEHGGYIFAPGALNLTTTPSDADAWSYMRNVYCYKASKNMHGCVCARNSGKLKLIDSAVVAPSSSSSLPLLIRNSGQIELQSSFVATLDGGNVIEFSQLSASGAAFTVGSGSAVYGGFSGYNTSVALDVRPTTYFTYDVTPYVSGATATATTVTLDKSYIASTGTKTDVEGLDVQEYRYSTSNEQATLTFAYVVSGDTSTVSTYKSGYPWRIQDGDGNFVYAKTLAPLAFNNTYKSVALTEDAVISSGEVLLIDTALVIDLGEHAISCTDGGFDYVLCTEGTGKLTVNIGNTGIRLGSRGFIRAEHTGEVEITSRGRLAAESLIYASDASVSVSGGNYLFTGGRGVNASGNVTLDGVTFYSEGALPMVSSEADVTISDANILAAPDACAVLAVGTLTVDNVCYVSGIARGEDVVINATSYFVTPPTSLGVSPSVVRDTSHKEIAVIVINGDLFGTKRVNFEFSYKTEKYVLTDEREENSVWKIELKDGTVKYAKHVYAPFGSVSEYNSMTLLSDLVLDTGLGMDLAGDLVIDLSGRKITETENISVPYLISAEGDGRLSVIAENSTVVLDSAALIRCNRIKGFQLSAEGAFMQSDTLATSFGTDITLSGGFYNALSGSAIVCDGSVSLNGLTVTAPTAGTLVFSEGDLTLSGNTALLAETGACAASTTGKLYMAAESRIYGTLKAVAISAEEGSLISYVPKNAECNLPMLSERNSESIKYVTYSDGELNVSDKKYIFLYKLAQLDEGLLVSFAFGTTCDLNVYVPDSVASSDFTLRIMLCGVLYDADTSDAELVRLGGNTRYRKFTYRYVYPTAYSDTVMLTLISGNFVKTLDATVGELLSASFAAAESDPVRTALATYARYSMAASGINPPTDWEMAAYVSDIRLPSRDTEMLGRYVAYVRYDVLMQKVVLARGEGMEGTFTVRYTFGGGELVYEFGSDVNEMELPVFRTDPYSQISITYTEDGSEPVSFDTDLAGIAVYANEGTSAAIYLGYLLAYADAIK